MPDTITFNDLFLHLSFMSPAFIVVFMILTSTINQDVKAFVWLAWAILGIFLISLLQPLFNKQNQEACTNTFAIKHLGMPWLGQYDSPSMSCFLIAFTIAYLAVPMHAYNSWNWYAILGFLFFLVIDITAKLRSTCTTIAGVVSGCIIGAAYGIACYAIVKAAKGDNMLYFKSGSTNNVYCSKPSQQTFKCYVYKNGEIISTI
jgi:hypothetical protein